METTPSWLLPFTIFLIGLLKLVLGDFATKLVYQRFWYTLYHKTTEATKNWNNPLLLASSFLLLCWLVSPKTGFPASIYKSVNLQYITLVCLDDGTNKSSTKRLTFHSFFYLMHSKLFMFIFFYSIENKKKIERSFAKNFARNLGKK